MLNLTQNHFSKHVFDLLNKNLNFCPTPNIFNKEILQNDLNRFFRLLKLKAHFKDKNNSVVKNKFEKNSNSNWTPANNHHTVNTYIALIQKEVSEQEIGKIPRNNLSVHERNALKELMARTDIIITKADKGGAVVIMDVNKYVEECNRQLNNKEYYKELTSDPTESHRRLINRTVRDFELQNTIDGITASNLVCDSDTRTPRFYALPKIHKVEIPTFESDIPGRPVISSVESHSSKISEYVDMTLQPIVKNMKSYVRDTSDFIRKLKTIDVVPEGSFLVSLDVRALYTNIPHEEGLSAVKKSMEKNGLETKKSLILNFLLLILTCNNFEFNGKHYIQTKGCAMGTKCAPTYANIFMEHFEEEYIYSKISDHVLTYLRYIDDIFMIWTSTRESFLNFINELNSIHPSIKFDYAISEKDISYLDATVYIDDDNTVKTKLYVKPTDKQSYLHYKSEHPINMKRNIPYSQALRMKRICSEETEYHKNTNKLLNVFTSRGYKKEAVEEQIAKADLVNRDQALTEKSKIESKRIPLVVTYNRTLPDLTAITRKHWHILQANDELKKVFAEPPMLAYRRNKNLKEFIGSNRISNNIVVKANNAVQVAEGQCKPCNIKKGSLCCTQVNNTTTFKGTNGELFRIRDNGNCKSRNVIYLMDCLYCKKILYVGKSEYPMNIRINKHRFDTLKEEQIEVDTHFKQHSHNFNRDARFTIIEQIKKTGDKNEIRFILEKRENFWITRLKTLKPHGLNQYLNRL